MIAIRDTLTAWLQWGEANCQKLVVDVPTNAQHMGQCILASTIQQHCLNQHDKSTYHWCLCNTNIWSVAFWYSVNISNIQHLTKIIIKPIGQIYVTYITVTCTYYRNRKLLLGKDGGRLIYSKLPLHTIILKQILWTHWSGSYFRHFIYFY